MKKICLILKKLPNGFQSPVLFCIPTSCIWQLPVSLHPFQLLQLSVLFTETILIDMPWYLHFSNSVDVDNFSCGHLPIYSLVKVLSKPSFYWSCLFSYCQSLRALYIFWVLFAHENCKYLLFVFVLWFSYHCFYQNKSLKCKKIHFLTFSLMEYAFGVMFKNLAYPHKDFLLTPLSYNLSYPFLLSCMLNVVLSAIFQTTDFLFYYV